MMARCSLRMRYKTSIVFFMLFFIFKQALAGQDAQIRKNMHRVNVIYNYYVNKNITKLMQLSRSNDLVEKKHIKSLLYTLEWKFKDAVLYAQKCIDENDVTDYQKLLHYACMIHLSRLYAYSGNIRSQYSVLLKMDKFYQEDMAHMRILNVDKYSSIVSRITAKDIKSWPKTHYSLINGNTYSKHDNGVIYVYINGVRVPLTIDTGSFGIIINKINIQSIINKMKLKNLLASTSVSGPYGGRAKLNLHTAYNVSIGPLSIKNAYIYIMDSANSFQDTAGTIGIDVISKLKHVTFTKKRILYSFLNTGSCNKLIFQPNFGVSYGLLIPLSTNYGSGLYFFDSGFDPYVTYKNKNNINSSILKKTSLAVFNSYASKLILKHKITVNKLNTMINIEGFGFRSRLRHIKYFKYKINNLSMHDDTYATILNLNIDPVNYGGYGIIGMNTIKNTKLSISIDFVGHRVCLLN